MTTVPGWWWVRRRAAARWRSGVERGALVAVSAAGWTIYDMCKAVDKNMLIGGIVLVDKVKEDV